MLKTSPSGQSALAGLEHKLVGRDPDDSQVPVPVRRGARLMLAGGAVTAVIGVFLVIVTIADKNAFTDSNGKKLSTGEFTSDLLGTIVSYLILIAVWVLMARMNRAGHSWARIVASILCAVSTYETFGLVNSLSSSDVFTAIGIVYLVVNIILWGIGVVSIAMIWRGESGAYYKARSAQRRALGAR